MIEYKKKNKNRMSPPQCCKNKDGSEADTCRDILEPEPRMIRQAAIVPDSKWSECETLAGVEAGQTQTSERGDVRNGRWAAEGAPVVPLRRREARGRWYQAQRGQGPSETPFVPAMQEKQRALRAPSDDQNSSGFLPREAASEMETSRARDRSPTDEISFVSGGGGGGHFLFLVGDQTEPP